MKWSILLLYFVLFITSIACILLGQRQIGPRGLFIMLAGLSGLLFLLKKYNQQFQ
ncbi:MAG: hypothetical protein HFI78_12355 [Lachnospiraceae bacterium]|jgi:drug/metabolite transporter (DMT)-like permease|nr:hypothetical protein [Lachnospiraceae bacterium]